MNQKPTECPICGALWLAEFGNAHTRRRVCQDCGAVRLFEQLALTNQELDEMHGPVCLTRNAHMLSKEGLNRLMDDLGL